MFFNVNFCVSLLFLTGLILGDFGSFTLRFETKKKVGDVIRLTLEQQNNNQALTSQVLQEIQLWDGNRFSAEEVLNN